MFRFQFPALCCSQQWPLQCKWSIARSSAPAPTCLSVCFDLLACLLGAVRTSVAWAPTPPLFWFGYSHWYSTAAASTATAIRVPVESLVLLAKKLVTETAAKAKPKSPVQRPTRRQHSSAFSGVGSGSSQLLLDLLTLINHRPLSSFSSLVNLHNPTFSSFIASKMSYRSGSEHHHHNHHNHHRNKAFSGGSSSHHSFDRDDSGGDDDWNREDAIVRGDDHFRAGSFRTLKTAAGGGDDQLSYSGVPAERIISYSPVNMYPRSAKMVISGEGSAPSDVSFLLSSKTRLCDEEDEEDDLEGRRRSSFFAGDIDQRREQTAAISFNVLSNHHLPPT